jgi:RND family efflux transporter MFP subunit
MSVFSRRSAIIGGILILLVVIIGLAVSNRKPKSTNITQAVIRTDLVQTVEVTGEVETISELDLTFEQTGLISEVTVKVGDQVKTGQILASLSAADLKADLARARASLALQKAGSREEDIVVAEAALKKAEAAYKAAINDLDFAQTSEGLTATSESAQVIKAREALRQAEIALSQTQDTNTQTLASVARDVYLASDDALIEIRAALSAADNILGIENVSANDDFQVYLGAGDAQTRINAENAYSFASQARDTAEDKRYALAEDAAQTEVDTAVGAVDDALTKASDLLLKTRQTLDATVGGSVGLSASELIAYKDDIDAARNAVQLQQVALSDALRAYNDSFTITANDLETAQAQVSSANAALILAQATGDQNNASAGQNILTAETVITQRAADVTKAQADLDKLINGARLVDLAPYEADVMAAQARLAKAQIIAPFDGEVTNIDIKPGQRVSSGAFAIGVEAADDQFVLPVNIPESDIAKVSVGDQSEVTLDAFGTRRVFSARVMTIESSETIIEGVVYYEAKVVFEDQPGLSDLRSGMSADVALQTDTRTQVLALPQRAVLVRPDGQTYVRIPKDEDFEERNVTVGLRANDGLLEIVNGVSQGDIVIVSLKQ